MALRLLTQYVNFGLSILILLIALSGIYFKRVKLYSSIMWAVFGFIGVVFYIWVLFTPAPHVIWSFTNTDISDIRTVVQYSLVASWLWLWTFQDLIRKNG